MQSYCRSVTDIYTKRVTYLMTLLKMIEMMRSKKVKKGLVRLIKKLLIRLLKWLSWNIEEEFLLLKQMWDSILSQPYLNMEMTIKLSQLINLRIRILALILTRMILPITWTQTHWKIHSSFKTLDSIIILCKMEEMMSNIRRNIIQISSRLHQA